MYAIRSYYVFQTIRRCASICVVAIYKRLPRACSARITSYNVCYTKLLRKHPKRKDTLKPLIDALNAFLLENHSKGRRTVLIRNNFV